MTISEAAKILGVSEKEVRKWQREGTFPKDIPDDFLDPFVNFRIQLQQALRRKIDRQRGLNDADE